MSSAAIRRVSGMALATRGTSALFVHGSPSFPGAPESLGAKNELSRWRALRHGVSRMGDQRCATRFRKNS